MNKKVFFLRYPFSWLVIIGIWTVCMIPMPEMPTTNMEFADKWTHFVMYGVLSLTVSIEYLRQHKVVKLLRFALSAMLLPIIMGGLVELAQAYLTTCRSGDWFDALCNALGAILGFTIALIVRKLL